MNINLDFAQWIQIIQIVTSIAIVATFFVYYKQLRVMRHSAQSQNLLNVINILADPERREDRKSVIDYKKIPYKGWDIKMKDRAERVCAYYDIVGILIENEVIPPNIIEDHWGDSIIKCYEAAGELIKEYRQQRGDDFWNNLDRLYERTKKRRNSNSTKR